MYVVYTGAKEVMVAMQDVARLSAFITPSSDTLFDFAADSLSKAWCGFILEDQCWEKEVCWFWMQQRAPSNGIYG
jgi:hypothetical protein